MNYELVKNEFIMLKKEELNYIDNVAKISSNKILMEYEKLEIYRNLNNYKVKLNEVIKRFCNEVIKQSTDINYEDVIIEFDIDKNYLSSIKSRNEQYANYLFKYLDINVETYKFKLTFQELLYLREGYRGIAYNIIVNNQKLIENPIYIFCGIYDASEDCYGPCFGEPDSYLYGIYENIRSSAYNNEKKEVPKNDIDNFEKDKIIIYPQRYVHAREIRIIFEKELLNIQNRTINDCVIKTKNKIEKLNYVRSPEYKEKKLLDRINELYKKVKGEFIQKEVLYSGNFLQILREIYRLPNENIVEKEKVVKNDGKNSVIVIAITQDEEYIITFQNRIKDKIIAEFPSGFIENGEEVIEAAKRELKEETGYITNDLFIVDEAFTSPGIDNSTTYIVKADNCIKIGNKIYSGTELVNYGLFSKTELEYLINNNIMNGAMNKLAYYNLISNLNGNKMVYKK